MQVQGKHPHQWAPFQIAGLLHAWQISHQISTSWGLIARASTLCNPSLPTAWRHLGPPRPMLSLNLYVKDCLDCTIGAFHMFIPAEPSLLQNEVQILNALSFHCRRWRFGFVNGQVSLAWSIALHTQELYTWPSVLKERWREERTDSSSLNFQAVFTHVVVESSQPPAAERIIFCAPENYFSNQYPTVKFKASQ